MLFAVNGLIENAIEFAVEMLCLAHDEMMPVKSTITIAKMTFFITINFLSL